MDDFAGIVMLRDGELDAADFRAAAAISDILSSREHRAVIQKFDRALLIEEHREPDGLGVSGAGKRPGIAFSGTIENRAELEKQLGVGRDGMSDSDLALRAFEAWGAKAVMRLRGAFSFVIYNPMTGQLFAVRDRFGIRPLHYLLLSDRILFGTRLSLLAEWPSFKRREADEDVILHYLAFGHAPIDRSPLKSCGKLKPGHRMTVQRMGAVSEERYWQLAPALQETPLRSPDRIAIELRERLDAIVVRQSAGRASISVLLDNLPAATAVLFSALRSGIAVSAPVLQFVLRKKGKVKPSSAHAAKQASVSVDSNAAVLALASLAQFDEPFGRVEAIRFQAFYDAAASGFSISPGGGDELLLAHERYGRFTNILAQTKTARNPVTGKRTFHQAKLFKRDLYGELIGNFSDAHRFIMAGPALAHTLVHSPVDDLGTGLERVTPESGEEAAARVDLQYRMPTFLGANDFALANGAPFPSCPFLDPEFVDACAALPAVFKGYDVNAAKPGVLLSAFLKRPEQTDALSLRAMNDVPIDEWLRTDLRELMQDTFASTAFRSRDLFNLPWLDRLITDHAAGAVQYGPQLWSLLCLESWLSAIQPKRTKFTGVAPKTIIHAQGVQ